MARQKITVRKQSAADREAEQLDRDLDAEGYTNSPNIPVYRGSKNIPKPDVERMKRDAFRRKYPHTSV